MNPATPSEIEAVALELAKFHCASASAALSHEYADAKWILSRFVRREEHERVIAENEDLCEAAKDCSGAEHEPYCRHYKGLKRENDRLRAELKGQRCDGSGRLIGSTGRFTLECPSCPACKPTATPPNIGYRRCCGSDQDKPHEEWCDNKPDATPKGDECECGHPVVRHSGLGCHASTCHCYRSRATFNSDGDRARQLVAPNPVLVGGEVVPLLVELGDRTLRALATLMTYRGGEKLLAELANTEEPKG